MKDPINRLQTLARAEMAVAQMRANRFAARSAMASVAGIFGLLALGMVTLALFLWLKTVMSPAAAAGTVGLIDGALAVLCLLIGRNAGPSKNEEQLALEIRDMAYSELNNDIEEVKGELRVITEDLKAIRSGVSGFSRSFASILPLIGGLIGKSKKQKVVYINSLLNSTDTRCSSEATTSHVTDSKTKTHLRSSTGISKTWIS